MSQVRGSAFARAIGTVLVLAFAAYMAAGLCAAMENDIDWAEVQHRSVERSFTSSGLVIRQELPLDGGQAPEARRIGAGDSLGDGLAAPVAGIYFGSRDGYEHLSPEDISSLDTEAIERLCASLPEEPAGGRLVTGKDWYFAALLPTDLSLETGTRLRVDFGSGELDCLVCNSGEGFAVLRMDTLLAQHASLRKSEAKIITETYSGLAIPKAALRQEEGENYVWAAAAGRLEKKNIDIIFTGEDFLLAALSPEAGALREGDKVLTSGEDLYEGKIIT